MQTEQIWDDEAWVRYPHQRWVFNKLELALRLGYLAGPGGVDVPVDGMYTVRPIYNLRGMGAGAETCHLSKGDDVPPGYFWCEIFHGDHYSIDYRKDNCNWIPHNAVIGQNDPDDLIRFSSWTVVDSPTFELPQFVHDIDSNDLNIELIDGNIIEIHMRRGNVNADGLPVGSKFFPIWEGVQYPHLEQFPFVVDRDGWKSNVRLGFRIQRASDSNIV